MSFGLLSSGFERQDIGDVLVNCNEIVAFRVGELVEDGGEKVYRLALDMSEGTTMKAKFKTMEEAQAMMKHLIKCKDNSVLHSFNAIDEFMPMVEDDNDRKKRAVITQLKELMS